MQVDVVDPEGQAVAGGVGLDGRRAEILAEPHDAALDDLARRGRRLVAPEGVGQPLGAHHLVAVEHEDRQHDPVTGADRAVRRVDHQGPENSHPHEEECSPW